MTVLRQVVGEKEGGHREASSLKSKCDATQGFRFSSWWVQIFLGAKVDETSEAEGILCS